MLSLTPLTPLWHEGNLSKLSVSAVVCSVMGVCLHVWVPWNTNQNKGAFTETAPSVRDVMTWVCFLPLPLEQLHVPALLCVQWEFSSVGFDFSPLGASPCSNKGLRHECVFVSVVAGCGCLGSRRKLVLQNPAWEFGNRSRGQNISFGCGCLWDSLLHVHVHQTACSCSSQPYALKSPLQKNGNARKWSVPNAPVVVTHKHVSFLWITFFQGKTFQFKSSTQSFPLQFIMATKPRCPIYLLTLRMTGFTKKTGWGLK